LLHADVRTRVGRIELDVELDVGRGRCLALAGPSGAGKSTVLRIIAGIVRPERGRVSCDGQVWLDTGAGVNLAPERRSCGYVFQDYALFAHLNAWQNVAYSLRSLPRHERRRRAEELLARFGLAHLCEARPTTLSGGERQRVAVARALARRPSVLLLDEPLSALDARTRASAQRELATVLRETGVPALLVTHDFAEAATLGDEVAVIDDGQLLQRGNPAELAATPASAFVADFIGAVVLRGFARAGAEGMTVVELEGGGSIASTDAAAGPVAASVFPWDIVIEPPGADGVSSARNRLPAQVQTVTTIGGRVRLGLGAAQPLVAEVTEAAVSELGLAPGVPVVATWKAAATRLLAG
jgi:molybdate transport system ATP-binding protein